MHAAHAQMMHLLVLVGTGGDAHQGAVFPCALMAISPASRLSSRVISSQLALGNAAVSRSCWMGWPARQVIPMARQGQQSLVGVDHHHLPALFMQLPDEVLTYLVGAHYHHMAPGRGEVTHRCVDRDGASASAPPG